MERRSVVIWAAGAIAAALVLFFAWHALRAPSVAVVHPTHGLAVQAVYATGTVEPTVMTSISPRIGARIAELKADEGDEVIAGQVLARLDNKDVVNNITQLAAQEDFARSDYERDARLVKGGIIARATYDKAKSAWVAAHAATEAARAQASYMLLTSPGKCSIIKRDGEEGQFIPINQPVFWLSCSSPLRISAEVDEEDISLVQPGQKVLIRADAFPGRVFDGSVQSITAKGDPVARSYRVRVSLPANAPLQIGMTAETNIIVHKRQNALLVPASALAADKLWVVRDGKLAQVAVRTGAKGTDQIEIESGVGDNDLVVVNPDTSFKEGARVNAEVK